MLRLRMPREPNPLRGSPFTCESSEHELRDSDAAPARWETIGTLRKGSFRAVSDESDAALDTSWRQSRSSSEERS
jgi:hypothetical protein